jgi:hypothetical protein
VPREHFLDAHIDEERWLLGANQAGHRGRLAWLKRAMSAIATAMPTITLKLMVDLRMVFLYQTHHNLDALCGCEDVFSG